MTHTSLQTYNNVKPTLQQRVYIADTARVIGNVSLGDDCSVWPMAVVRGDIHTITIGRRTSIQDNAVIHCTHKSSYTPDGFATTIGNDVTIGHSAVLHGCTIGDRTLIGINSTVLDGAVVASDVMIGACSLVPPNAQLESGFLYIGVPARKSRKLSDSEIEYLRYGASNYVQVKDNYLAQES